MRVYCYDVHVGDRFLQTDPIGYEDQMNLYAYVGNDPMNKMDSSGMQSHCAHYYEQKGNTGVCTDWNSDSSSKSSKAGNDAVAGYVKKEMFSMKNKFKKREYYGVVFQNKKGDIQSVVVRGGKTWVDTKDAQKAYSLAHKIGVKRYLAEWHNHPTEEGGSHFPSPDDVRNANSIAAQAGSHYRTFFSTPRGNVMEWDTSESDSTIAIQNLINHGKWEE